MIVEVVQFFLLGTKETSFDLNIETKGEKFLNFAFLFWVVLKFAVGRTFETRVVNHAIDFIFGKVVARLHSKLGV